MTLTDWLAIAAIIISVLSYFQGRAVVRREKRSDFWRLRAETESEVIEATLALEMAGARIKQTQDLVLYRRGLLDSRRDLYSRMEVVHEQAKAIGAAFGLEAMLPEASWKPMAEFTDPDLDGLSAATQSALATAKDALARTRALRPDVKRAHEALAEYAGVAREVKMSASQSLARAEEHERAVRASTEEVLEIVGRMREAVAKAEQVTARFGKLDRPPSS
jgi:methyl-accepting chemotaxis protein